MAKRRISELEAELAISRRAMELLKEHTSRSARANRHSGVPGWPAQLPVAGRRERHRLAAAIAGALKMVPFLADHLAWLCPQFGDVEPWPEQLAEAQSARSTR